MSARRDINAARRLVIHCGVQKTASTSLHHFVRRNRDLLRPHLNILTPVKGGPARAMGRAAMQFSLDPSAKRKERLSSLISGLRDQLADDGSAPVLISHENLPGAMLGKGGVTTLYPLLERITDLLNRHLAPFVPDYVFCTRKMSDWKRSVFNQAVKSDRYSHPRSVFEADTADCGTWDELHQRMRAHLGADRVRFFRVEDETEPGKPGLQILRHAGLGEDVIASLVPMGRPRNTSLNSGALEFLRLANARNLDREARRAITELVSTNQSLFVSKAV